MMKSKKSNAGTKKQAAAVAAAQLQAKFGETIESVAEIVKENKSKKKKHQKSSK